METRNKMLNMEICKNFGSIIVKYIYKPIILVNYKILNGKKENTNNLHLSTIVMCTPMFITTLFPIAKIQKQLKCPSTDRWIKKTWYIYTMQIYAAIKIE